MTHTYCEQCVRSGNREVLTIQALRACELCGSVGERSVYSSEYFRPNDGDFHNWDCDATLPPAVIYDASGSKIERVVRCNVETGEVVRIDNVDRRFSTISEIREAPLVIYFKGWKH